MSEMTNLQVAEMDMEQIRAAFRKAADMQRENKAITWEHGIDLVNIIALHGNKIADRLTN